MSALNLKTFSQYSETDTLKKVVIGKWEQYAAHKDYVELVNESQKKGLPSREDLKEDLSQFRKVLESFGVEVLIPEYVGPFVYDQLTPRDIGITIGDRFVICNMVRRSRRYEIAGIFNHLIPMIDESANLLIPEDPDILLEGGDVLIHKSRIFAGLSQRSNQKGMNYLQKTFGRDFEVISVQCRRLEEGQDVLHLDCALNFIGEELVLIYPDGIRDIPECIEKEYRWLEVDAIEQSYLATNVLSVNKNIVIARKHPKLKRVNQMLRDAGLEVMEVPFDATARTGGSVRCGSLPLVRER